MPERQFSQQTQSFLAGLITKEAAMRALQDRGVKTGAAIREAQRQQKQALQSPTGVLAGDGVTKSGEE